MFRTATIVISLALALGGCSAVPVAQFSWYHPQGGEYLFDYDAGECQTLASDRGQAHSVDPTSPFFRCMYQRGYVLVDEQGMPSGPAIASSATPPTLSQQ
jgi:hypothetical protein